MFEKDYISRTPNIFSSNTNTAIISRNIFWGEVVSIDDETEGGRIRVKVPQFDLKLTDDDVPYSYPLLPKFFHVYPQKGEIVRVFIEDTRYPNKARYWMGSVISQLQKIKYDGVFTALSTTNYGVSKPDKALSTYKYSEGVMPLKTDIALIGRDNADIIHKNGESVWRVGKHNMNDVYTLNVNNPGSIRLVFESVDENVTRSSTIIQSDKIALISHDGNPNFKHYELNKEDRDKIFTEGHALPRGDVLVAALEIIRSAIINHIHGYSGLPADKSFTISDLEKIDFNQMLQKNIVIN